MVRKIQFALIGVVVLVGCSKAPEGKENVAPVQVTAVTQATIRRIVQGDGALYPLDQASIMPKITAPVQKFYVNRGDHVKQGQLVAVLENRDLVYAAAESKGAVDQAEANLRTTEISTVPESIVKAQTDLPPPATHVKARENFWKRTNGYSKRVRWRVAWSMRHSLRTCRQIASTKPQTSI